MPSLRIDDHYFGFTPTKGHRPTCTLAGTNLWEVAVLHCQSTDPEDEYQSEVAVRMTCSRCRVFMIESGRGGSSESGALERIGYGMPAQRSCGLFLHPGPPLNLSFARDQGPEAFYVTGSETAPATVDDLIGIISWYQTRRGATRWRSGCPMIQGEYGGIYPKETAEDFKSRRAAVQWVADRHAQALAAVVGS